MDQTVNKFQISTSDFKEIETLRKDYLTSLPEFQELYLELMVPDATKYQVKDHEEIIGYAIITSEKILIEFHLIEKCIPHCNEIFKYLMEQLLVKSIYCKSFDFILLNCCLVQSLPYKLIGAHYRNYFYTEIRISPDLTHRLAQEDDIPFLLKQEDGLYETQDELKMFVKGRNISMFYADEKFVGCGFMIRVHPDWDYFDIGMWVNPLYRKQGYALQIISVLKETCLKNNHKPICGCDIDNIASQKTLEKCGFYSKYKLIGFYNPANTTT
jgi:RimJ/RimL family protein N-acetyltransferase